MLGNAHFDWAQNARDLSAFWPTAAGPDYLELEGTKAVACMLNSLNRQHQT